MSTLSSGNRPPPCEMEIVWLSERTIINLRGDAHDPKLARGVACAIEVPLPSRGESTSNGHTRLIWAGPDDWFVIGKPHLADSISAKLRHELHAVHHAVTDVSGGYQALQMHETSAYEILGQGCPLDLHHRVFKAGMCASSVFYNASIWVWRPKESSGFEVMFRRSFMGYVQLMLERGQPSACIRKPDKNEMRPAD